MKPSRPQTMTALAVVGYSASLGAVLLGRSAFAQGNEALTPAAGVAMIGDGSGRGRPPPFPPPHSHSDGTRDDAFITFWRWPHGGNGWQEMQFGTSGYREAYFTDNWVAMVTRCQAVLDGDSWRVRYTKPNGSTGSFGNITYYSVLNGELDCFTGCDSCPICGTTILNVYWYTDARCEPTGVWTWGFYKTVPAPEDLIHEESFFLRPADPDPVPFVSQCGWGDSTYDHVPGGTICRWGCFLATLTMVYRHYGLPATENPSTLNDWLKTHNGFGGASVYPCVLTEHARNLGSTANYCGKIVTGEHWLLRRYICLYGPQVIRVSFVGQEAHHFLVAYGMPDDGTDDFWIKDASESISWDRLLSSYVAEHGSCNGADFCEIRVIKNESCTCAEDGLYIYTDEDVMFQGRGTPAVLGRGGTTSGSPVEFLVTDAQGRRTGFDASRNRAFNEIPNATYAPGGAHSHDPADPLLHTIEFEALQAPAGNFGLRVFGTRNGTYNLRSLGIQSSDQASQVELLHVSVQQGSEHTYTLGHASGSPILLQATCPYRCGDLNGDSVVDVADFAILQRSYGSPTNLASIDHVCTDRDGDGSIDFDDFELFANSMGRSAPQVEVPYETCGDGADNDCDGLTDCADADCLDQLSCQFCGNGNCEAGEDCESCLQDCPGVSHGPPSGRYCCGNGIQEGPEGDGAICDDNP